MRAPRVVRATAPPAWALVAALSTAATLDASAEPLPPGSLGVFAGGVSGTGADASRIGFGYLLGVHAAWQPMTTERRFGASLRWSALFGKMFSAEAARITSELDTLQMDVTGGLRVRPGVSPQRYLTLRAGPALFRANQLIPPYGQRAFVGGVANLGLEHYLTSWMFTFDLRYSEIWNGPAAIALVIGFAKIGP